MIERIKLEYAYHDFQRYQTSLPWLSLVAEAYHDAGAKGFELSCPTLLTQYFYYRCSCSLVAYGKWKRHESSGIICNESGLHKH